MQSLITLLLAQCLLSRVLSVQVQLQADNDTVPSLDMRTDDDITTIHFPAPQDPARHQYAALTKDEDWMSSDRENENWLDEVLAGSLLGLSLGGDAALDGDLRTWLEESAAREQTFFDSADSLPHMGYNTSIEVAEEATTQHEPSLTDIATMMQADNLTCFGFVVLKTWGYREDEWAVWDAFWTSWTGYFDQYMRDLASRSDAAGQNVASLLRWHLVEDPALDDASIETLRARFKAEICEDDKGVEDGINVSLALVPTSGIAWMRIHNIETAVVLGIDVYSPIEFTAEERREQEAAHRERFGIPIDSPSVTRIFEGHLEVAVNALIPDAWHALEVGDAAELWRCSGDWQIYRGWIACQEEGLGFLETITRGPGPLGGFSYH